jgi:hypothetical protein
MASKRAQLKRCLAIQMSLPELWSLENPLETLSWFRKRTTSGAEARKQGYLYRRAKALLHPVRAKFVQRARRLGLCSQLWIRIH